MHKSNTKETFHLFVGNILLGFLVFISLDYVIVFDKMI